jgi:tripartite-type tricarboxylate transporter receptor subunit TctC
MSTRRTLLGFLAAAAAGTAQAQGTDWPSRSIRMISPFPPGGAADLLARVLAEELTAILRQSVVVENRTGAGGSVGAEATVRSPPDGYTLMMGSTGPIAINPALIRLSYDPVRDLTPIAAVAAVASVLVVHPALPARSLADVLALARAEPGKLSYGSSGIGSAQHLFMELLKQQANVDLTHIPYRGTGPAMVDTVGGRLAMMFDTTPTALPHIRDGRVRALAVSAGRRDPALPDVPTIAEAGLAGYEALGWYGLFAPAGVPAALVERLNREVNILLARPDFRAKLSAQGVEAMGGTPQEFAATIARDRARWGEVIQRGNIRADG